MNTRKCAAVATYELGDDTVIFHEHTGELLRLNPTAAAVWKGLRSGMPSTEIVELLAGNFGISAEQIRGDVERLVSGFEEAGLLREHDQCVANQQPQSAEACAAPAFARRPLHFWERCYAIADFQFRLRTPSRAVQAETHALLAHLALPESASPEAVIDLVDGWDQWFLMSEEGVIAKCPKASGFIPMVHAHLLLTAYRHSTCMAAVHAAVVTRNQNCILMPAPSGSGKTTLAAVLMARGFGYCADDLALLTNDPVRVRPVATSLGLKSGSWKVVEHLFPELNQLPEYRRSDGKRIKYLPSRDTRAGDSYIPRCIIFPSWEPGCPTELKNISSAEALTRLTEAGYDLPQRINRDLVGALIGWISQIPCFTLRFESAEDAAREISGVFA
jgi:hypothetical protein